MSVPPAADTDEELRWIDRILRLVLLAVLLGWSGLVVSPFVEPVVWGAILAVALYPTYARLERRLGGRRKTAAGLYVLLLLGLLAVPTILLTETLVDGVTRINHAYEAGELRVPPPPESVERWPFVGERVTAAWRLAAQDLHAAATQWAPQLERARHAIVGFARNTVFAVVEMLFSLVVMGAFLANAASSERLARAFGRRVAAGRGDALVSLARDTTRSVARGIVGVALIQGLLSGVGCLAASVPAAGLWALGVLVLSVAQLSPLLVLGPVAAYLFHEGGPVWISVAFTVWSLLISVLDNVLKPLLLGRGVGAPMLVVFLGAIGGLLHSGILGLFLGPVLLVVTFSLVQSWIAPE